MLRTLTKLLKSGWKIPLTSSRCNYLEFGPWCPAHCLTNFYFIFSKLLQNEGIVIEPNLEDLRKAETEEEVNYFPNTDAELEELLNNPMMEDESDDGKVVEDIFYPHNIRIPLIFCDCKRLHDLAEFLLDFLIYLT